MIYFIHGPDRLLARESALSIVADVDPDRVNTAWLDSRESSLQRITDAIGTVSFFGTPRVVVVTDFLGRATRDSADDGGDSPERPARSQTGLDLLLAAVPEDHCLILLEPALAQAPAVIKSAGSRVKVVASNPPRGSALVAWIENAAQRAGSEIDRRTAQTLAETLYPQTWNRVPNNPRFDFPPDMGLISCEIEKLAAAAYPGPITSQHILELVPGGADQRLFRFLDAAIDGDLRSAITELERLLDAGDETAAVLAQLLGNIELRAVALAARGKDSAIVARDLGSVPSARVSAIMSRAGYQSALRAAPLANAVTADRRLKTGRLRNPADALHDLVLALAGRGSRPPVGSST